MTTPVAPNSTVSGAGSSNATQPPSVVAAPAAQPNALDQQMIEGLRRMGIRAPKTYDPKRDSKFEVWLERVENYMNISQCRNQDRTATLLLLLDVNTFETAKNMRITNTTPYDDAKQRLTAFLAATETPEEMKQKLALRQQEVGESIETFATAIQQLGHKAYPTGDEKMLEDILLRSFILGLRDDKTRERVMLRSCESLTDAVKYARFAEAATRVVRRTPSTTSADASTLNAVGYYKGGFTSNYRGRGGVQSSFRGQYAGPRPQGRGGYRQYNEPGQPGYNSGSGTNEYSNNSYAPGRTIYCFNCGKVGHKWRVCRSAPQPAECRLAPSQPPAPAGGRGRMTSNYRGRPNGQHVSAISNKPNDDEDVEAIDEGEEKEGAVGYTSNSVNNIPATGSTVSPFHQYRKLCAVPGEINGHSIKRVLVDGGSPVTIMRKDLWSTVRTTPALDKELETFQGVTHEGLQILGITRLKLRFGALCVIHPVLIADKIAHRFILGNDFLTQYNCDILNTKKAIDFGGKQVSYDLFRSTINTISPVICSSTTVHAQHKWSGTRSSTRVASTTKRFTSISYVPVTTLLLLLFWSPALADNAFPSFIMHSYGAVAENCGKVAIDEGPAFFSMILRLELQQEEVHFRDCGGNTSTARIVEEHSQIPSWMDATEPRTTTVNERNDGTRPKRFLPLLFGIAGVASSILSVGTSIYTFSQINEIKAKMQIVNEHLANLDSAVTANHDALVTVTKSTESLYEYTHANFRKVADALRALKCETYSDIDKIAWLIHRNRLKARLYSDFDSAVTTVFGGRPTPILLPKAALRELIKENPFWFNNTIYQTNLDYVYQYGAVHPILPILYKQIGYILSLPRILNPEHTGLYCVTSNAVIHGNKLYKYSLPENFIFFNGSMQELLPSNCQNLPENVKLCNKRLHVRELPCLENQSLCEVTIKDYERSIYVTTSDGYLIATKSTCSEKSVTEETPVPTPANGVIFQPFDFTGVFQCQDGLSLPSENRNLVYKTIFSAHYEHVKAPEIEPYTVTEWTDYKKIKDLESGLARQYLKKYSQFSQTNLHWIWPIIAMALAIIYIGTIVAIIYYYCRKCRSVRRVRFRAHYDHTQNIAQDLLGGLALQQATSILQAKEVAPLSSQAQGTVTIPQPAPPTKQTKSWNSKGLDF